MEPGIDSALRPVLAKARLEEGLPPAALPTLGAMIDAYIGYVLEATSHNVARAAGNVADGSNLRWVSFEYAFLTGIMQYGSNASLRLFGATVDGEFVDNLANRSFPHTNGHRTQGTKAAFVRASGTANQVSRATSVRLGNPFSAGCITARPRRRGDARGRSTRGVPAAGV